MKGLYSGQGNAIIISMKKFLILVLIIPIFLMAGCLDNYVPVEDYSELQSAYDTISDKYVEADQDRIDLRNENKNLKSDIGNLENETEKYQTLLRNLNSLLENIYYGYASNANWESEGFTAFSLNYRDKIFLITAGHCIHYNFEGLDTGLYTKIKVKNFKGDWIYPKLLKYENDFNSNRDYAILYSDKINSGLDFDINNNFPKFILGNRNLNTIKDFSIHTLKDKESGSPIIDIDGEVIEIATGNFVDIDLVLDAIDNLK